MPDGLAPPQTTGPPFRDDVHILSSPEFVSRPISLYLALLLEYLSMVPSCDSLW
jgi:hypothetical protein